LKAIRIRTPGGPEVLELVDVETPAPRAFEVRIRVAATAVNRADLLQRMGAYPAPEGAPQDIPGLEVAGTVDALGEGVTSPAVGTRVYAIVGGGAYAEYVTVHARALAPIPPGLGDVEAAAVPEAFVTAYDAYAVQAFEVSAID
jgi:NADPH:quinone reductase-like Zn-dependent oxidoreductase